MHRQRLRDLTLAALACLALGACGDKGADKGGGKPGAPAGDGAPAEGHAPAPHGGEVLELGAEEGHAEVVHDAKAGTLTLYLYGSSTDKPIAVAKPSVSVQTASGPVELVLAGVDAKADGTAHSWKALHEGLKADPLKGRLRVTIAGKALQADLEPAGHAHK